MMPNTYPSDPSRWQRAIDEARHRVEKHSLDLARGRADHWTRTLLEDALRELRDLLDHPPRGLRR